VAETLVTDVVDGKGELLVTVACLLTSPGEGEASGGIIASFLVKCLHSIKLRVHESILANSILNPICSAFVITSIGGFRPCRLTKLVLERVVAAANRSRLVCSLVSVEHVVVVEVKEVVARKCLTKSASNVLGSLSSNNS